jgi:hypothetical protein
MSGEYLETVAIIPTSVGADGNGINVISEPGVDITVNLGGGGQAWIKDDAVNGYAIRINWEGAFGFGKYRPITTPASTIRITGDGDMLYKSQINSHLRFKNVCIVKDDEDTVTSKGIFYLNGDITYGTATTLWLDGCRIQTLGIYSPIISVANTGAPTGFKYNIDVKSSEIIWYGEYAGGNPYTRSCFYFRPALGVALRMSNSYIFGYNPAGNDVPIYLGGNGNNIYLDDVQFYAFDNFASVETIYSLTAGAPIWISSRCLSWFNLPVNCTNPIFGVLDCNLTPHLQLFPNPII